LGTEINLVACRGEFEPGTFGLFAVRDLKNVSLVHSILKTDSGLELPAETAELFHVQSWYQAGVGTIHPGRKTLLAELLVRDPSLVSVDPSSRENRLHFEGLPRDAETLQPIAIPAFESRQIWVTYRIPETAAAGTYHGTISVCDAKSTLAGIPVQIRVPEWDLAHSPMLHGFYYSRRCPSGMKTIEEEDAFFALVEKELKNQIEHGCNVTATYIHTSPLPSDPSPCATAQRVNDIMKKYGVTGTPYFGVVDHVGFQQGDQLARVTERARLLDAWARKNGRDGFCFQGRDEASGERLREQRPSWKACRAGGGKMWVACRPSYFEVMGDILDYPVVTGRLRPELAEKVHANGFKILSYGNPQVGVELPALYRRNYGLALRAAGYDGSINYAYGSLDPEEAYDDFDGEGYRDHTFAYPAQDRPIDTIQYEGWREAVDDVRYARTLEEFIEWCDTTDRSPQWAEESREFLRSITGFEDLDHVRSEIIRRIDRLAAAAEAGRN
jgi:hypothetical protein